METTKGRNENFTAEHTEIFIGYNRVRLDKENRPLKSKILTRRCEILDSATRNQHTSEKGCYRLFENFKRSKPTIIFYTGRVIPVHLLPGLEMETSNGKEKVTRFYNYRQHEIYEKIFSHIYINFFFKKTHY